MRLAKDGGGAGKGDGGDDFVGLCFHVVDGF
jgi:hypothetical protein